MVDASWMSWISTNYVWCPRCVHYWIQDVQDASTIGNLWTILGKCQNVSEIVSFSMVFEVAESYDIGYIIRLTEFNAYFIFYFTQTHRNAQISLKTRIVDGHVWTRILRKIDNVKKIDQQDLRRPSSSRTSRFQIWKSRKSEFCNLILPRTVGICGHLGRMVDGPKSWCWSCCRRVARPGPIGSRMLRHKPIFIFRENIFFYN